MVPDTVKPSRGIHLWGLLSAVGAVTSLATILAFLGPLHWAFDLFSHFPVQYAAILAITACLLLIPRQLATAAVYGVLALFNLSLVLPLYFNSRQSAAPPAQTVRALLLNLNSDAHSTDKVTALIRSNSPDIVLLEELTDRWLRELQPVLATYPYRHALPRDDNFGILLASRYPVAQIGAVTLAEAAPPSLLATVSLPYGDVTLLGTHPVPPAGGTYTRLRDRHLSAIPSLLKQTKTPVLIMGDLNTTPWNHAFKKLLADSDLHNSMKGNGIQPTWPTFLPFVQIPLDHFLHSSDIAVVNRKVGEHVGSDHYPLIVDFSIKQ